MTAQFAETHFQEIYAIAAQMNDCASLAVTQYEPIADDIINGVITDPHEIDLQMDYMCDFCFNDEMLLLFKKVCRAILYKHPDIVVSHINQYRKLWDSDVAEEED
jgi:hypothetical protein